MEIVFVRFPRQYKVYSVIWRAHIHTLRTLPIRVHSSSQGIEDLSSCNRNTRRVPRNVTIDPSSCTHTHTSRYVCNTVPYHKSSLKESLCIVKRDRHRVLFRWPFRVFQMTIIPKRVTRQKVPPRFPLSDVSSLRIIFLMKIVLRPIARKISDFSTTKMPSSCVPSRK